MAGRRHADYSRAIVSSFQFCCNFLAYLINGCQSVDFSQDSFFTVVFDQRGGQRVVSDKSHLQRSRIVITPDWLATLPCVASAPKDAAEQSSFIHSKFNDQI